MYIYFCNILIYIYFIFLFSLNKPDERTSQFLDNEDAFREENLESRRHIKIKVRWRSPRCVHVSDVDVDDVIKLLVTCGPESKLTPTVRDNSLVQTVARPTKPTATRPSERTELRLMIGYITDTRVSRHDNAVTAVAVKASRIPKGTTFCIYTFFRGKQYRWKSSARTIEFCETLKSITFSIKEIRYTYIYTYIYEIH